MEKRAPPGWLPDDAAIARHLGRRDPWLRRRKPHYQVQMIKDLAALIPASARKVLDIGAGSGLVGETIATLFPEKWVAGVDVHPNALPDLSIPYVRFDGSRLPFSDRSFDCALFCNSLHHVLPEARHQLLREALRVTGGGTLVIKDHMGAGLHDRLRLWALDVLGNAARGFMVSASYLGPAQWDRLLQDLGCSGEMLPVSPYRSGLWSWCFPNRLEISFRAHPKRSL